MESWWVFIMYQIECIESSNLNSNSVSHPFCRSKNWDSDGFSASKWQNQEPEQGNVSRTTLDMSWLFTNIRVHTCLWEIPGREIPSPGSYTFSVLCTLLNWPSEKYTNVQMPYFPSILPGLGIFIFVYLLGEKLYLSIRQIPLGNQVLTDMVRKGFVVRRTVTVKPE